jgi:hypothetical protein
MPWWRREVYSEQPNAWKLYLVLAGLFPGTALWDLAIGHPVLTIGGAVVAAGWVGVSVCAFRVARRGRSGPTRGHLDS